MLYMIYAPSERPLIEPIVEQLSREFEVKLAPVGLMAGSPEWQNIVEADIQSCKAAIVVLTEISAQDETVALRYVAARKANLKILPLFWDNTSRQILFEKLHPDLRDLMRFQGIAYYMQHQGSSGIETIIKHLADSVPRKPKSVLCFLSYSRSDTDFAAKLASDLRAANVETWRDAENIPAGANWDREIEKALNDCAYVLLLATPHSVASENVMDEIGLALNKGKTVIPVMVETCDLPLRVHRAQWVDFRTDYPAALEKLLEQLGMKKS
jgi:hypothetical protein